MFWSSEPPEMCIMDDLILHLLYSYAVSGLILGTGVEKELLNELTKTSYLNMRHVQKVKIQRS